MLIYHQIIEYENRIRQFSTPDKVFRYFATIQVPMSDDRHEIFMTPVDFLTSMTPGMKHPEGMLIIHWFGLEEIKRPDMFHWHEYKYISQQLLHTKLYNILYNIALSQTENFLHHFSIFNHFLLSILFLFIGLGLDQYKRYDPKVCGNWFPLLTLIYRIDILIYRMIPISNFP